MKLIGFENNNCTCYLNAVIQCFIYDPYFKEIVCELDVFKNIFEHIDLTDNEKDTFTRVNLMDLIHDFVKYKDWFEPFQQNDSHEFLVSFIDYIIMKTPSTIDMDTDDERWLHFLKSNPSLLTNYVHGQVRNTIVCHECKHESISYEEFNSINLNVENYNNLTDIFKNYLKKEINDDPHNLYYCDHCKKNVISQKGTKLWRLPKKLILVLKKYNGPKVPIDIDTFLCVRESKTNNLNNYKLSSLINHHGIMVGGHYTSVNNICDEYYLFDDDTIHKVKSGLMENRNAYILMFNQID
jgi:ubiquitin C-terminal hydrolase